MIEKSTTNSKELKSRLAKSKHFVCICWTDNLHLTKKYDDDDIFLISTWLAHDDILTMKIFSEIQELKKTR
jgi:hypothetical protein